MKAAKEFLSALFEHATRSCVVSYANDRSEAKKFPPQELYGETEAKVLKFIKANDVPGRAVYACVSDILPKQRRSKATVGGTFAAFTDLDFKGIAFTRTQIEVALDILPLDPTFVIFTGNGLHLWWMFDEPCADHARVEALLKNIARVMAGDPAVCEVSRVMRIPDTHNSKNGANHLVKILKRSDKRYTVEELEEYFLHAMPLLYRKATETPVAEKRSAFERLDEINRSYGVTADGPRVDVDELWDNIHYPGNVNETIVRATASMLSRGVPVDEVVETVCSEVWDRVPEAAQGWSWPAELSKVREECLRWMVKHGDVLEAQGDDLPPWVAKDSRIKKAKRQLADETHGLGNGSLVAPAKLNGSTPHLPQNNAPAASTEAPPYDLWNKNKPPPLPEGLLPAVIERFVRARAVQMGTDPAGLAVSALCAAGAAIPDCIQLQVKVNDPYWLESARLWVATVGSVSALKSPVFKEVTRALKRIDGRLAAESAGQRAKWEEGGKEGPEPPKRRLMINDPTIEAIGEIAQDNPDGLMYARDELSGMLGSIEKYAARGSGADRGFYLSAFNGEDYTFDRIKRGSGRVDHLGISLLGGIQPDTIRKYDDIGADDGLVQRINPVIVEDSTKDLDVPMPPDAKLFDELIEKLFNMPRQMFGCLKFTPKAQKIREMNADENMRLRDGLKSFNTKFAGHLGKYNGMFARLCVIFHCIENCGATMPDVDEDVATRVHRFMHEFLVRHAAAFYFGVLGVADNNDKLMAVAGFILAHPEKFANGYVTNRHLMQSVRSMRGLDKNEIEKVFHNLDTLNWVSRVAPKRAGDPPSWRVNPMVFQLYHGRAEQERVRREDVKALLDELSTVSTLHTTH